MIFTLHHYAASSASWRVRSVLHHKGIKFKHVLLDLIKKDNQSEAYRVINPAMRVPCLQIECESGKIVNMAESQSICDFLDQKFPDRPLYPKDIFLRQKTSEICCVINSAIQPLQNIGVQRALKNSYGVENPLLFSKEFVVKGLGVLEQIVNKDTLFCLGDQVQMCDIFLIPQLYWCRNHQVSLTPYPNLLKVEQNFKSDRNLLAAFPENYKVL